MEKSRTQSSRGNYVGNALGVFALVVSLIALIYSHTEAKESERLASDANSVARRALDGQESQAAAEAAADAAAVSITQGPGGLSFTIRNLSRRPLRSVRVLSTNNARHLAVSPQDQMRVSVQPDDFQASLEDIAGCRSVNVTVAAFGSVSRFFSGQFFGLTWKDAANTDWLVSTDENDGVRTGLPLEFNKTNLAQNRTQITAITGGQC